MIPDKGIENVWRQNKIQEKRYDVIFLFNLYYKIFGCSVGVPVYEHNHLAIFAGPSCTRFYFNSRVVKDNFLSLFWMIY